jgi:hypothetical protein
VKKLRKKKTALSCQVKKVEDQPKLPGEEAEDLPAQNAVVRAIACRVLFHILQALLEPAEKCRLHFCTFRTIITFCTICTYIINWFFLFI